MWTRAQGRNRVLGSGMRVDDRGERRRRRRLRVDCRGCRMVAISAKNCPERNIVRICRQDRSRIWSNQASGDLTVANKRMGHFSHSGILEHRLERISKPRRTEKSATRVSTLNEKTKKQRRILLGKTNLQKYICLGKLQECQEKCVCALHL